MLVKLPYDSVSFLDAIGMVWRFRADCLLHGRTFTVLRPGLFDRRRRALRFHLREADSIHGSRLLKCAQLFCR